MKLKVKTVCPVCGKVSIIEVEENGYKAFLSREKLIQDALPELPCEQREQLLSGICPTCWDIIMSEDEDF